MIFCFKKMEVNRLPTNSATGHCALRSIFHALFINYFTARVIAAVPRVTSRINTGETKFENH